MKEEDSSIPRSTKEDGRGSDLQGTSPSKKKKMMKMKTSKSGKSEDKEARKKKKYWMGCLRAESDESGNVDLTVDFPGDRTEPSHLVVMVNGLIGSAQNWRFAAKKMLKKYPQDLVVHCSKRNHSTHTFDGVDVMGERLAEEVRCVIKRYPSLQKISFVGHSLGGLIARYAIGCLYEKESRQELPKNSDDIGIEELKERIAGLEPMYFITSATPHLGSRGHKHVSLEHFCFIFPTLEFAINVPLFSGSHNLERLATRLSWCLGKTGKHLFLADGDDGKPPLLLRMVSDSSDLKFISALRCFKRRIAYANTSFDHLVGWTTSSIRRHNELPKLKRGPVNEKYPHIVNVEATVTASNHEEDRSGTNSNGFKNFDMEGCLSGNLACPSWPSYLDFLKHFFIQVKTKMINSAGADVIQHMIDNFEP